MSICATFCCSAVKFAARHRKITGDLPLLSWSRRVALVYRVSRTIHWRISWSVIAVVSTCSLLVSPSEVLTFDFILRLGERKNAVLLLERVETFMQSRAWVLVSVEL